MKTIINYFKKRQEERLRTKIALRTGYAVNDLQTVYEFIKNGTSVSNDTKSLADCRVISPEEYTVRRFIPDKISFNGTVVFTDKFGTTIDGAL